jgi:hypothetical protein
MRPDVLAGLSRRQRLRQEIIDLEYVAGLSHVRTANRQDAEAVKAFTGKSIDDIPIYTPDEPVIVICQRVDLDHPIMFMDNKFGNCADCGCDIQYRPDTPNFDHVCVCCAARRHREDSA